MHHPALDEGEGLRHEVEDTTDEPADDQDNDPTKPADMAVVVGAQELERRRQHPRDAGQGHIARGQRGDHDHLALILQQTIEQIRANTAQVDLEGPGVVRRGSGHHLAAALQLKTGICPDPETIIKEIIYI